MPLDPSQIFSNGCKVLSLPIHSTSSLSAPPSLMGKPAGKTSLFQVLQSARVLRSLLPLPVPLSLSTGNPTFTPPLLLPLLQAPLNVTSLGKPFLFFSHCTLYIYFIVFLSCSWIIVLFMGLSQLLVSRQNRPGPGVWSQTAQLRSELCHLLVSLLHASISSSAK